MKAKRITRRTPRSGRKGVGMPTGIISPSTRHGGTTRKGLKGTGRKGTYKP
jgi:hypothetical protein